MLIEARAARAHSHLTPQELRRQAVQTTDVGHRATFEQDQSEIDPG
jgi:hypothetical protein